MVSQCIYRFDSVPVVSQEWSWWRSFDSILLQEPEWSISVPKIVDGIKLHVKNDKLTTGIPEKHD